jgi:hypothetical protein
MPALVSAPVSTFSLFLSPIYFMLFVVVVVVFGFRANLALFNFH